MSSLCEISSRPIKGTEDKIFLLKKTIITSIWGMRRKGREPEQQTTKFGGEQIDIWICEKKSLRWEKLGSSKNDLCPLGGIFFVWLNVMAAKTSFWLNTLAWSRVHLLSTMHHSFDIWIEPRFEWRNCDKRCHDAIVPDKIEALASRIQRLAIENRYKK